MNWIKKSSFILPCALLFACTKGNVTPGPVSTFTVINAIVGSSPITPIFDTGSIQWFANAETINYASSYEYSVPGIVEPVLIYQGTDTATSIFGGSFTFKPQSIYSLFLAGQLIQGSHNSIDTLFTQDFPPYYDESDSVTGVRFVNLSSGSSAISVNIVGNAPGSEVASLPYKGVSQFKAYSATTSINNYDFEIRDTQSDSLLSSYSL